MWLEFKSKTNMSVNMDKILWVEPTPGGTQTNLVLAPGVAVTVNDTYDEVMMRLEPMRRMMPGQYIPPGHLRDLVKEREERQNPSG